MSRPLALAFVGWRTAVLIGAGLLRLGGRIPDRARTPTDALRCKRHRRRPDAPETTCPNHPRRSVKGEEQGGERDERARDRPPASCAFDAYVPAEKHRVTELREEGFISDLFFKSDKSGPILVLSNTNRDEAQWRLATLPLVEAGYLAFEQLIEFN
jgi:hypothetical protein